MTHRDLLDRELLVPLLHELVDTLRHDIHEEHEVCVDAGPCYHQFDQGFQEVLRRLARQLPIALARRPRVLLAVAGLPAPPILTGRGLRPLPPL